MLRSRPAISAADEARAWTQKFLRWYNHEHKHSGLKFVTPAQRHHGVAPQCLCNVTPLMQRPDGAIHGVGTDRRATGN